MPLFTSESVTPGHPDKLCDQISDAILDAYLARDPEARVAVEVMATAGGLIIAGEVRSSARVGRTSVAVRVLEEVGYPDYARLMILDRVVAQSPEIAAGVDASLEARDSSADPLDLLGAGDQGIMFGYACRETPELMPLPISLAHALARRLRDVAAEDDFEVLGPDGKTQATVRYDDHGAPVAVESVLISTQHMAGLSPASLRRIVLAEVVAPVLERAGFAVAPDRVIVNPSGSFVLGGPAADAGLTGRKIIVDTYGGSARHGGGAFSGKDPSKVDRSAAYALRWVAKHVVAADLASRCEVQVAYAIGSARPVSVHVETFGTGNDARIAKAIEAVFDLRPAAIVRDLDLRRPIYEATAAFGHFGITGGARRELGARPWEVLSPSRILALQFAFARPI